MKLMFRFKMLLVLACLLAGCAGTPQSRVQAPASQETVLGQARTRAKAHTDLGFEYYAQKQLGIALQEANIAIKDDAGYAPAYNLLALVHVSLGDIRAAEEAFQRAMQISTGDPEVANNYGWFLCQSKREAQSLRYFIDAVQNPLYPTPLVALSNAGECAMKIGDHAAAEGYLQQVLDQAPNSTRALMLMANLKYQQKQYAQARGYLLDLHRNAEPIAGTAYLAYRIARITGNRDEEARYLALLRKKFPDSDEFKKILHGAAE